MHGLRLIAALVLAGSLGACQSTDLSTALKADTTSITSSTGAGPSIDEALVGRPKAGDDDIAAGKAHFRNANYGLAEKHFRQAVETGAPNLEALVGLAASYDQLGRFELADRAYKEAFRMGGSNPALLNNRGYSYYLRRDFGKARADFSEALRRDPQNTTARRNLELVNRRG